MSTVVNKAPPDGDPAFPSFHVLPSANTPDFPPQQWVRNSPNLSGLIGTGTTENPQTPKRYWIVSPSNSQNLREMTPAEKAVVDGNPAELAAARSVRIAVLRQQVSDYLASRYDEFLQRAFQQAVVRATGSRLIALNAWFDWLTTVYSANKAGELAVAAAITVPTIEAVTVNYVPFDATDPLTSFLSVVP